MIAKHPPMGWNSWDCYGAAVNEALVRQNADYMAEHLKPYGWEYVIVDIQWYQPTADSYDYKPFAELCMDAYGRLQPAENRFPSASGGAGFRSLADSVHSLGLKFGIHMMRGIPRMAAHRRLPILGASSTCDEAANPNSICPWNPDMYGVRADSPAGRAYYDSLFSLYASWGVDYVKCDDISDRYPCCEKEIEVLSAACRGCGREMVLSLSPGPAPLEHAEHLKQYANMWRLSGDFWDSWPQLKGMFKLAEKWCIHVGPGHWPDLDMLPVGAIRQITSEKEWTRLSEAELRTMMTLWCILPSPLMLGGELTKCDAFTLSLITNAEVLTMNQSVYGAHPLYTREEEAAWIAQGPDRCYVALFNLSDAERDVMLPLAQIGLEQATAKELWTGKEESGKSLCATLKAHDAAVWRLN